MIDPQDPFFFGGGRFLNGGPYTWHVTDMDQRRHFAVTYDPPVPIDRENDEELEGTEQICAKQLLRHLHKLGQGVYGIRFTEPDGPITIITDPKEDVTLYVNNYPLSALKLPFPVKTISMACLTELDRIQWSVDLVSYPASPHAGNGPSKTIAVFKYWYMFNGMDRSWYELNNWSRLPRDHPHIVPFDSVVLDSVTEKVVGFTSLFIPGGTLFDNNATTRTFRLRWLHQLLSVVDDLNYRYGIMHQDIAPRNLIIDEEDNLRVFDFNYSAMIDECYMDDWEGVVFTLYEIITLDGQWRSKIPRNEQDAKPLLEMEWVKHADVKLDSDVKTFRDVLDVWLNERKSKKFELADTWVRWDRIPAAPIGPTAHYDQHGQVIGKKMKSTVSLQRRNLIKWGEPFFNWERPPNPLQMEASRKIDAEATKHEALKKEDTGDNELKEEATGDKELKEEDIGDNELKEEATGDNELKEEATGDKKLKEEAVDKKAEENNTTGQGVMDKETVGVDQDVVGDAAQDMMQKEESQRPDEGPKNSSLRG
ncbi:hypothetical protein E4U42_000069 [Claviceps africana]|uniref:EKC/KEOPS complex subunit BUD32 n=1 Tax=Claviceps africana TaxID=83212 RepID=A0A8K0J0E2_9HYPO|nr:hypothetical protein E4U42_000069 [Claviceps africana]